MIVKEFIQILNNYDENSEVQFWYDDDDSNLSLIQIVNGTVKTNLFNEEHGEPDSTFVKLYLQQEDN